MPKPPRTAVWLIEFFVPPATAEPAVGDLAEEFAARAGGSEAKARLWYWRQTLQTIPQLMWASVRLAPWSAAALVLGSLVVAALAGRAINGLASLLLANVNAYDYVSAVWYWRAVDGIRFVVMPFAVGWSVAAIDRERGLVITTLAAAVLIAIFGWNLAVLVERHLAASGLLFGSPGGRRLLYELVQAGTTFPLSLLAGGVLWRIRQRYNESELTQS
jgi:hypothetical protein